MNGEMRKRTQANNPKPRKVYGEETYNREGSAEVGL